MGTDFMFISIVAAVVIFALLILVHEAGHFVVAKRLGVRVLRFSIGYPPKIFGIRRGETEYAIGATPLGGYVRMLGDEVAEEPTPASIESYLEEVKQDLLAAARASGWSKKGANPEDTITAMAERLGSPGNVATAEQAMAILNRELKAEEAFLLREVRKYGSAERAIKTLSETRPSVVLEFFKARAFPNQRLAKRITIVLAGPAANLLFAPVLLTIVFLFGVPTLLPILGKVQQGLPAQAAGLKVGDRVLSINGQPLEDWQQLSATVKDGDGAPLRIELERHEGRTVKRIMVVVKPALRQEKTVYGNEAATWVIGVMPRGDQGSHRLGPVEAIRGGFTETVHMTQTLLVGIAKIVEGATPMREALGGPIMIAQMAGHVAHQGLADLALFTVMLSIELGIINLLPVPLLDGGHLLFFVCEAVRGKPLKLRHREIAMEVGLFLLAILMFYVVLNDVSRIIQG
jgi:regulator of sigma E protease